MKLTNKVELRESLERVLSKPDTQDTSQANSEEATGDQGSCKRTEIHAAIPNLERNLVKAIKQGESIDDLLDNMDSTTYNRMRDKGIDIFSHAAKYNNDTAVSKLLERGESVDRVLDNLGNTALHVAAAHGCDEVLKLLINKGASINSTNYSRDYRMTPLLLAIKNGKLKTAKLLIGLGADVKVPNANEGSPLHYLAEIAKLRSDKNAQTRQAVYELLKTLLEDKEADVNAKSFSGVTPIMFAIKSNQPLGHIKLFIDNGAKLNDEEFTGTLSPLAEAMKYSNDEIFELLLENGANPLATSDKGFGLMNLALSRVYNADGDFSKAERLLNKGFDINQRNLDSKERETLLHAQIDEIFKKRKDAIADTTTDFSKPYLEGSIKFLLEKGADVNAKDANEYTVLHKAIFLQDYNLVKFLLDHDAKIDTRDKDDDSPLLLAAATHHKPICELLLEKGANINDTSKEWGGIIRRASISNNFDPDFANFLIQNGADPSILDSQGRTFIDYFEAFELGKSEVIEFLRSLDRQITREVEGTES